jgi:hypothetical protein
MHFFRALVPFSNFFLHLLIAALRSKPGCDGAVCGVRGAAGGVGAGVADGGAVKVRHTPPAALPCSSKAPMSDPSAPVADEFARPG